MSISGRPIIKQLIHFLWVGGVAVLIDALVYFTLSLLAGVAPNHAKIVSFAAGAAWAFFGNRVFTFQSTGQRRKEVPLFVLVYLSSWWLNSIIHDQVYAASGEVKLIAFLAATAVSTIFNFLMQKFVVFRNVKS